MEFSPKRFFWIGDGITLARSWPKDIDEINARLRAWDRAETQVFDGGRPDRLSDFERCWTIRDREELVGYIATTPFAHESLLSRRRFVVELTTEHVWKMKVRYVRYSRAVLKAVAGSTAPWVSDFFTLPMKAYEGTVRWQERVLGMHRVEEIEVDGIPHVLLHITRAEIENGKEQ